MTILYPKQKFLKVKDVQGRPERGGRVEDELRFGRPSTSKDELQVSQLRYWCTINLKDYLGYRVSLLELYRKLVHFVLLEKLLRGKN